MLALIKMPYGMYKLLVSHFEVVSKTNIYWDFIILSGIVLKSLPTLYAIK